jgi:hypothetical protein
MDQLDWIQDIATNGHNGWLTLVQELRESGALSSVQGTRQSLKYTR